jgi:hypothetical protein
LALWRVAPQPARIGILHMLQGFANSSPMTAPEPEPVTPAAPSVRPRGRAVR